MNANRIQAGIFVAAVIGLLLTCWGIWRAQSDFLMREGADRQTLKDAVVNIDKKMDALDAMLNRQVLDIRETLVAGRAARDAQIQRNEDRRDITDRQQLDATNRLLDRVNKLTDQIMAQRPHSELMQPLAEIGG